MADLFWALKQEMLKIEKTGAPNVVHWFKQSYSGYLSVRDQSEIYFCTNFPHAEYINAKDVLVFNYGLVCSNEHWRTQLPYFDQLGFKILIHDYRHHFQSKGKGGVTTCTFKNIVSDLKEVISSLAIQNIHLIGHSMGVNVCLEYAHSHPQDVERMILISGTVFPPQDVMFDSNIMEIVTPLVAQLKNKAPALLDLIWSSTHLNPLAVKLTHRGGFNLSQVDEAMIKIYLEKVGELSVDLFLQLFHEMKRHDIISKLDSITSQTLVIGGDKDKIIPNYLQRILIDHLPNAEMYMVKDGSHVPQWDFPETINAVILDYIS
jgi:non-heme chloroperoxidase